MKRSEFGMKLLNSLKKNWSVLNGKLLSISLAAWITVFQMWYDKSDTFGGLITVPSILIDEREMSLLLFSKPSNNGYQIVMKCCADLFNDMFFTFVKQNWISLLNESWNVLPVRATECNETTVSDQINANMRQTIGVLFIVVPSSSVTMPITWSQMSW